MSDTVTEASAAHELAGRLATALELADQHLKVKADDLEQVGPWLSQFTVDDGGRSFRVDVREIS